MKHETNILDAAAILSAITGVLYGLGAYVVIRLVGVENPNTLYIAFCVGLTFALLLFPYLVLSQKRKERKYARFEEILSSPIFCRANANFFTAPGKPCNGRIYLCEKEIVFASLEKRTPLVDRVAWDEIENVQAYRQMNVTIKVNDGRAYCMQTPDFDVIAAALQERNIRFARQTGELKMEIIPVTEPPCKPRPVLVVDVGEKHFLRAHRG